MMRANSFYYWLSDQPLILRYAASDNYDVGDALPRTRVYRLPMYYWHRSADQIERYHVQATANCPEHVLHHLINEQSLCRELTARGIPATFTSQNAFTDERIFSVRPASVKRYDAVYNARMAPFKRHVLARAVPSLLILGGVHAQSDDWDYFRRLRNELPQAHFTHAADNGWMQPNQVAEALNTARVGLCLSACEGAMYAATEYLLCGLPVVSTRSLGGRDVWFDTRYVRIVADDPEAIADAVRELIALNLSPEWIRQATLRRVWQHRRRFIQLVQDIYDRELVCRDYAREWYAKFFHQMGRWRDLADVMQFVQSDCAQPTENDARRQTAKAPQNACGGWDKFLDVLSELVKPRDENMDLARLVQLFRLLAQTVLRDVAGDVIEVGCYRGHTAAFLQKALDSLGCAKRLHVYDSFRGLPGCCEHDAGAEPFLKAGSLACSPDEVRRMFASRGARPPEIHAGWFRETLEHALPAAIAFAHVDGDLYESTLVALQHVYPRLSPGAVVVIDDYTWRGTPGVKRACGHFFTGKPETVAPLSGTNQGHFCKVSR